MKIFLTLLLLVLFSSCGIAQVEQKPLYKVKATVATIVEGIAVLDSSSDFDYQAPAQDLEMYKEYLFLLDIVDCGTCRTKKAVIVWYRITPAQAQSDMNAIPEDLAKRIKNKI